MTAHRLNPTDDTLIKILARYVSMTAAQCSRHPDTPASLNFIRKHLTQLVQSGMVEKSMGFSQSGKPPLVYSPSR